MRNTSHITVKDLMSILGHYDEGRVVIIQKDSEGNSFSPLSEVWNEGYEAESTWQGEPSMDGVPAVFLVPIN